MATVEKIAEYVRLLLERLLVGALEFVAFLLSKGGQASTDSDRSVMNRLSLESAMRGMEADDGPVYGEGDVKVIFSRRRQIGLPSISFRRRLS